MKAELVFFQSQINAKGLVVPAHVHSCYELVYYATGRGVTMLGEVEHAFSENTFSLITPRLQHSERTSSRSELIYFGFRCTELSINIRPGIHTDTKDLTIYKILLKMQEEVTQKRVYYRERLNCYVTEVLVEWGRGEHHVVPDVESKFAYIINYINENYHSDIDFEKLSDIYCLSYHRFRHLFKDFTGFSPAHFVLLTRLRRAREMLRIGANSVTDIAYSCGFSSPSQFATLFKKHFGKSPSGFRTESEG